MTELDRQVRRTQVRLWGNRWLRHMCWTTTGATVLFAGLVLVCRLYGLDWPLLWIGVGAAGAAVSAAVIWSLIGRPDRHVAAAALDEAAGLRERVSSGLYCTTSDDPFAQAVLQDAQSVAGSVVVRRHIRLRFPSPAIYTFAAIVVAVVMLLLPDGMLQRSEAKERRELANAAERTRIEVREQLKPIKKIAETNPALEDLRKELERIEQAPAGQMMRPEDIRREAIKKVDKLSDTLRQERQSDRFDKISEMKKMLRRVQRQSGGLTEKLNKALAKGDFKGAKEELKQLQDTLATLKHEEDQEMVKQLQDQLKDLAKQLDSVADEKQLREKLEQAGVKKEDIERALKSLSKKDLDQLKKQCQENGMSKKDAEQLAKQLQSNRAACTACKQMSKAMSNAASAAGKGDMEGAAGQMESAGEQLSELEQLEQEMNQLDSQLSQCQNAKNGMQPGCNGQGQKPGQGNGMGKLGQGQGGLAPEDGTGAVSFKTHRQKVHTGAGKIIGQFLVDGEQLKGGVSSELAEVVAAEERDATDAVNQDRIPRQYQKSVKEYFSYVQKALGKPTEPAGGDEPSSDTESDGGDTGSSTPSSDGED